MTHEPPGFPLSSGFTRYEPAGPGYCVDRLCWEHGPRHLHPDRNAVVLNPADEAFVRAVEDALDDMDQQADQDALDVALHGTRTDG